MHNVTAIIISFLRPAYTIACVKSLKETYPDIQILVGENGDYEPELADLVKEVGGRYIKLPYDSGVCVGRNTLMQEVQTEYVLVGDDDFFYTKDAMVDRMHTLLVNNPQIDLIGGRIRENGTIRNYQGSIERHDRMLRNTPINLDDGPQYSIDPESNLQWVKTDLVFNFFVARKASIIDIPWDNQIKVAYEHESWFIDLQDANRFVAFSPNPIVVHKPDHIRDIVEKSQKHPQYQQFRMRRNDKERFFTRHKLDYVIDMNGNRDDRPDSPVDKRKNDVKGVDFCITTFKRPQALKRLLFSIAKYYPMANVYVADQNETFDREFYKALRTELYDAGLVKRVSFESLPFDCGLSYARNHLVTTTPNQYKLILDDDMEFCEETDIGKMVTLFQANPYAGVVGGMVRQLGNDIHFEFYPEIKDGTLYHANGDIVWRTHQGIQYRRTGCVLNFALFKKEVFNQVQWDPNLKVTEHTDFYLRFKDTPYQVLYTPEVVIEHPPVERTGDYKEFRTRPEFLVYMMKKHKLNKIIYQNGQTYQLNDDGSVSHYRSPKFID